MDDPISEDYGDPIAGLGFGDLETPGSIAAASDFIPNLPLPSSAILASVLPTNSISLMPTAVPTTSLSGYVNTTNSSYDLSSGSGYTSLVNGLVGIGSSLTQAFVTNPQNAATQAALSAANANTAEQEALLNAGITQQQSSSIFSYLIFGVIIFLIFQFIERE